MHRDVRRVVATSTIVAAWAAWRAYLTWPVSGLSWHFFAEGSKLLLHGSGLNIYAEHPELQIGPLSLAVAALLRPLSASVAQTVALVGMTIAGPLLVAAITPLVAPARRHLRMFLAAMLVVPAWTVLSVRFGHLDDVIAMICAIVALRAVVADRPVLAGAVLAAAVAAKPWALGFLPLLLVLPRGRLRAAAITAAGTLAAWAPFVLFNVRTFTALHPPVNLAPASGLHTLGARGDTVPAWGRTTQLVLSPAAALGAGLIKRWPGVLLVCVAVRLALDPQDNGYYIGSAALAAAVFDLLGTGWTIPWTTLSTVVILWQPFVHDFAHRLQTTTGITHWWFAHPGGVGALHLAWSLAMVVIVAVVPVRERAGPRTALSGKMARSLPFASRSKTPGAVGAADDEAAATRDGDV